MNKGFINNVLSGALSAGAQEAELFIQTARGLSVEVKELQPESIETYNTFGYGLRIIKDGKVGFSYSTHQEHFKDVIIRAIASSIHVNAQDINKFPSLGKINYNMEMDIYDENVNSLNSDDALNRVLLMEKSALTEKAVNKIRKAEGSFGVSETYLINTLGIDNYYQSTHVSAYIVLSAERDGENQTGWDFQANRFIDAINFQEIGCNAAKRATMMLGAKKISSFKGLVVLDSFSAINFLGLISSSFNAESVQKERSIMKGKIGQIVLSKKIDIIDSANLKGLLGTRPFDSEGVPTGETVIVEEGYLKAFLYNTFTALKDGVSSTGNAVRSGFTSIPSVGINNLFIRPSKKSEVVSRDEIIKAVDKGIYITEILGMHTANSITGEFSVGISGLLIKDGIIIYPFKEAMVSGNVFDLLNNIALIGDNIKFYGNIGAPTLLIENIDINA